MGDALTTALVNVSANATGEGFKSFQGFSAGENYQKVKRNIEELYNAYRSGVFRTSTKILEIHIDDNIREIYKLNIKTSKTSNYPAVLLKTLSMKRFASALRC